MNQAKQVLLFVALMLSGCQTNHQFDAQEWQRNGADWYITDVREKMVDDLIQSDTLMGKTTKEVIKLLGSPSSKKSMKFSYVIREKYGRDIDPQYISNLLISFNNKGKVSRYEIEKLK